MFTVRDAVRGPWLKEAVADPEEMLQADAGNGPPVGCIDWRSSNEELEGARMYDSPVDLLVSWIRSAPRNTAVSVVVSTVSCCPFAWMPAISLPEESVSRTTARHLDHRETCNERSESIDIDSPSRNCSFHSTRTSPLPQTVCRPTPTQRAARSQGRNSASGPAYSASPVKPPMGWTWPVRPLLRFTCSQARSLRRSSTRAARSPMPLKSMSSGPAPYTARRRS